MVSKHGIAGPADALQAPARDAHRFDFGPTSPPSGADPAARNLQPWGAQSSWTPSATPQQSLTSLATFSTRSSTASVRPERTTQCWGPRAKDWLRRRNNRERWCQNTSPSRPASSFATRCASVATAPNERWSTDMCRVWPGRGDWATLALMIDCHTRELLGWHLS